MAQYTNNVKITMNPTKTEVFFNFSQDTVNASNEKETAPVADLVMTGELAQKIIIMLSTLFATPSTPTNQPEKETE
ncbi:MAG: hypothetical protein LIO95_01635 [Clostridiales bacterium]|nr:hypothetical protein [Clostridiales bacterium]